jgi:uncharacterized FlaG/YvyC family protein|tara:strand:+ start:357 stop:797 length:441 start_codon:yes stop_codon:yes gene_type:complete
MENIDRTTSATPRPNNSNEKIVPQGTSEIKSKKSIGSKEYDAEKLRTQNYKSRLDARKNLEMAQERLKELSTSLNADIKVKSKNLKFSVDPVTNRLLVTVSDKESGKVIGKIPSEATLKLVKFIQDGVDFTHSLEALKGILYDDKY